jgi:GNAT superfamily N-acetyltransferase
MTIRRAGPGDLDVLVDLHRSFCDTDDHPFDGDRARAAFLALLVDDRHGVVWIVDPAEGYAVLTWGWSIEAGGLEAVLDEIFVNHRGEGRGTELVEYVAKDAQRRGVNRIFLETESHNRRGRALYARCGFVVEDSIWMSRTFEHPC